jgi:hypothetical protein
MITEVKRRKNADAGQKREPMAEENADAPRNDERINAELTNEDDKYLL